MKTGNTFTFGDVEISETNNPSFSYTLMGANLSSNITLTLGGTNPTAFTIANNGTEANPITLNKNAGNAINATITVTFNPSTTGINQTATLTTTGGGVTNPVYTLTGSGIADPVTPTSPTLTPSFSVADPVMKTGNAFTFGDVEISEANNPSFSYTLMGSNLSSNITLTLGGTNPTAFTIANNGTEANPITLNKNAGNAINATITVTFNPSTTGINQTATLTTTGGGATIPVYTLTGSGIADPVTPVTPSIPGTASDNDVDDNDNGLIEVRTLNELNNIRYSLAGASYKTSTDDAGTSEGCKTGGCFGYELTRSLDFADAASYDGGTIITDWRPNNNDPSVATNAGFLPIAHYDGFFDQESDDTSEAYIGTFDGNGFTISNLYINTTDKSAGLFGYVDALQHPTVELRNTLTVANVGLLSAYVKGVNYVGGLIGNGHAVIDNVFVRGHVIGTDATSIVGGLIGIASGEITNSYTTGTVRGSSIVGGLVGQNFNVLRNSFSASDVFATGGTTPAIGGLVGTTYGPPAPLRNSYAAGDVTCSVNGARVGGLVGLVSTLQGGVDTSEIENVYATGAVSATGTNVEVGGLIGNDFNGGVDTTLRSYWDKETTGQTTSENSIESSGKTTTELKALTATTTSWDEKNWDFGDNTKYPSLLSYTKRTGTITQIKGNLLCAQPGDRLRCPTLEFSNTAPTLTAAGNTTAVNIPITSNVNFDVTSDQSWVTITAPAGGQGTAATTNISFTYTANNTSEAREAILTATQTGGSGTALTDNITLTQPAAGTTVTPSIVFRTAPTLIAAGNATAVNIPIISNVNFDVTSDQSWVTITAPAGGQGTAATTNISFTYTANNTSEAREAILTATQTGGSGTALTDNITLTQPAAGTTVTPSIVFRTAPTLIAAGNTTAVNIPIISNVNFNVTSDQSWVTITAPAGGQGTAATTNISFTYTANNTSEAREAILTATQTGGSGTALTDNITLTQPADNTALGINLLANKNIHLSPNPVTDQLLVQGDGLLQVAVRTVAGTVVGDYTFVDSGVVDFSALPIGLYIVQIQTISSVSTQRILRR